MADFTIPAGLAGYALKQAIEYAKGDELDRLFAELGDHFGEETGLSTAGLAPLREDPEVLRPIVEFFERDTLDEDALIDAIEPHLFQIDEQTPPREVAKQIAMAIKLLAYRARRSPTEAIVHDNRRLHEEARSWAAPRYLSLGWVPASAKAHIERLSRQDANAARYLEDALADELDQARALRALILSPPQWLRDSSAAAWQALGHLAGARGLWELAENAFVAAVDRPGADRPSLYAKAAEMANARGKLRLRDEYLDKGRSLQVDHPELILGEARTLDDAAAQLEILSGVSAEHEPLQAAIEASRALAHLSLGNIEEAEAAATRAAESYGDSPFVRELRPLVVLFRNIARPWSDDVETDALRDAASDFLGLRDELLEVERSDEACGMTARAAEAFGIAGELPKAREVLEGIPASRIDSTADETRIHLAQTALRIQEPELAVRFIPPGATTDQARVVAAAAAAATADEEGLRSAVRELDRLIGSDDERVQAQAALSRLNAATDHPGIPWSDAAESIVTAIDSTLAGLLKAQWLLAIGEAAQAEDLLLDHQENPRALELLIDLASKAEDWPKAIRLAESLLQQAETPVRRLLYAELLLRGGRGTAALEHLAAVRTDPSISTPVRAHAFALSAQHAWNADDFAEAARLTGEWLSLLPTSTNAAWGHLQALAKIGDYAVARETYEQLSIAPRDVTDARLVAYVFSRSLDAEDALARIIALSDLFDHADEQLEALVVLTGLRVRGELPEEIAKRLQSALNEFSERFPNSQMIQQFPAPETPEEIEEFFRENFAKGAQQQAETERQVARGEATVVVLAALAHRDVSTTWGRLGRLPIAFSDPAVQEIETTDALSAIGGGAVLDPSAQTILSGLSDKIQAAVLRSYPGSVVPQSVREDVDRSANEVIETGADELMFAGWDPARNSPSITIVDSEWIARDRERGQRTLELAKRLDVVPDTRPAEPTRFDEVACGCRPSRYASELAQRALR